MIKLCLFDFDGTLCETHDAIVHCMNLTFDYHNHPRPPVERIDAAIRGGVGIAETFSKLHAIGLSVEESEAWRAVYRTIYNSGEGEARSALFEGALTLLKTLKERGCAIIVVSNKGEEAVLKGVSHFGLSPYVDLVVAERPGVILKPDPSSYHEFIAPFYPKIHLNDVLMIGDTPADIKYAQNIGIEICWARYGYGDPDLCLALRPDYSIDRLVDIKNYL